MTYDGNELMTLFFKQDDVDDINDWESFHPSCRAIGNDEDIRKIEVMFVITDIGSSQIIL